MLKQVRGTRAILHFATKRADEQKIACVHRPPIENKMQTGCLFKHSQNASILVNDARVFVFNPYGCGYHIQEPKNSLGYAYVGKTIFFLERSLNAWYIISIPEIISTIKNPILLAHRTLIELIYKICKNSKEQEPLACSPTDEKKIVDGWFIYGFMVY